MTKRDRVGVRGQMQSEAWVVVLLLSCLLTNKNIPHARSRGRGCHELRIPDENRTWRIVYYVAAVAIVILEVFAKTTSQTPQTVIDICKARLKHYKSI